MVTEADPPSFVYHNSGAETPLVIAVPHAGRHYPTTIERDRAVPISTLEQIEDRYADRLIAPLVAGGAIAIVATYARAWIDLNRGPEDLTSARERGGLGLIPSRLAGRALWREPAPREQVLSRLAHIHRPYHAAISEALRLAHTRHGYALLIDCHSMPPLRRGPGAGARIVVGDRMGTSADHDIGKTAMLIAEQRGLRTSRNTPYAGAYTLKRHGRPHANVHAIQIEMDRTLYLDAALRETTPLLPMAAALLADIAWSALAAAAPIASLAAE